MVKRLFDIVFSFLGLWLSSPFFLGACLWIKLDTLGPVFYRGVRAGRNGRQFRIFKFRTMVVDAEKVGPSSTANDDPRITRSGVFLRDYKLDELPQLINVLKGDMSLVGPRPQVLWVVDLYSKDDKAVLDVRPGIADYAFVLLPSEGEVLRGSKDPDGDYLENIHPEKMRLSLYYVRNHSFWFDMKILVDTAVLSFFKRSLFLH